VLEFLRDFLNASYLFTQSSLQIFRIAGLIYSSHLDPPFHQPLRLSPSRAIAAAAAAAAGGGGGGHQLLHHLRRGPVHGREVAGDAHGEAAFAQGTGRLGKVYKNHGNNVKKPCNLCFFFLKKGDFQKIPKKMEKWGFQGVYVCMLLVMILCWGSMFHLRL